METIKMNAKAFFVWVIAGWMTSMGCLAQGRFELSEYTGDEKISNINISSSGKNVVLGSVKVSAAKFEITCTNQNILKLYTLAYNDIPEKNFLFPKELAYINSSDTRQKCYNLSFSGTGAQLIEKLNSTFGLKTAVIKVDSAALELKKIKGGSNVKPFNSTQTENTVVSTDKVVEIKGQFSLKEFANTITNQLGYSVIYDESIENDTYEINLAIDGNKPIAELIVFFENEGITFRKRNNQTEYVNITK
ncbi:hypothetical protein FACS1894123_09370 [Bacteroidia bacterium]|nr:hypothetical protein FACS1894123_09370 [Bacteroidia bacterium]